jgi:hypothetical protein
MNSGYLEILWNMTKYTLSIASLLMNPAKDVVFFGAGASAGCGDVNPHTPPLGNELYGQLKARFPATWGRLGSWIAEPFENFEKGMKLAFESGSSLELQSLMCEMGVYFSEFESVNDSNLSLRYLFNC